MEELAEALARHLREHLASVEYQTTSVSSRFLDACRVFSRGELPEDRLVETTAQLSFTDVIDAFSHHGRDARANVSRVLGSLGGRGHPSSRRWTLTMHHDRSTPPCTV